jgi:hypothetical protein
MVAGQTGSLEVVGSVLSNVRFGSKADIARRPDGYGVDKSRLALHGAGSGGAAMIALNSDYICGEIGGVTQGGDLRAVRRAQ